MKPRAARPEVFASLNFPRPMSMDPLSPAQSDAALIAQLRGDNAAKDAQIEALMADVQTQANIIRDFQADVVMLEARPTLKLIRTFDDMSASFATVAMLCTGLRGLGKEPIMEWHGDLDGRVWLTVSIEV